MERSAPGQQFEFEVVSVNARGDVVERQIHRAHQFTEDLGNGIVLELVLVPGGAFWMGSRPGHGYDDERPQHVVRVTPFLLGKYPVTQEQWEAVMKWKPPFRGKGAKHPADRVSWHAARDFCRRLSMRPQRFSETLEVSRRAYRLPSEAEWEYACRAGSTTPFHCGETITTDLANYVGEHTYLSEPKGVYRHGTTEVGQFPPNAFGLYDMHGNLWEWCADAWHTDYAGAPTNGSAWERGEPSHRVLRGGSWHDPPNLCRCAARLRLAPAEGEDYVGFRVALTSL